MRTKSAARTRARRSALAALVALGMSGGHAAWAEAVNPDADEILRSMSKFLAATKAFSVSADISNEIITFDSQKLQFNARADVLLERPSRFHVTRQGRFADTELFYDGSKLTVYARTANAYVQKAVAGTIDQAISTLEIESGLSLPGADLLLSDPYAVLSAGVLSSGYYGREYVGGVACHHLAFRTSSVDWQIWVKEGAEPLPMKYVITTKWTTAAPQYSVQLRDWNTRPKTGADRFEFAAPRGARKLERLAVDELEEVAPSGEGTR